MDQTQAAEAWNVTSLGGKEPGLVREVEVEFVLVGVGLRQACALSVITCL